MFTYIHTTKFSAGSTLRVPIVRVSVRSETMRCSQGRFYDDYRILLFL